MAAMCEGRPNWCDDLRSPLVPAHSGIYPNSALDIPGSQAWGFCMRAGASSALLISIEHSTRPELLHHSSQVARFS